MDDGGRDITVVGGGIGGMAASLLLARSGAAVTMLERASGSTAVGAGILLQPNGLAVLEGLGLRAEVEVRGSTFGGSVVRNETGARISDLQTPDFGGGLDHLVAVRRSALHDVLATAVAAEPGIESRYDCEVTGVDASGTVEMMWRGEGSTLASSLVVGADGVDSCVRRGGEFGATRGRTGSLYLRGLVPLPREPLSGEYWTPLGLFGGAQVDEETQYFYASASADPVAGAVRNRDLPALREAWSLGLPQAAPILDAVSAFDDLLVNAVTRVDCERWYDDRLVLLGDAAHAMEPTLGQGANTALVDAAILADQLATSSSLGAALEAYTQRRARTVKRVQDRADALAKASALRNPLAKRARDGAMRMLGSLPGSSERLVSGIQQEDPARLAAMVDGTTHPHE